MEAAMFIEKRLGKKMVVSCFNSRPQYLSGFLTFIQTASTNCMKSASNLRIFCFCILNTSISNESKSFLELVVVQLTKNYIFLIIKKFLIQNIPCLDLKLSQLNSYLWLILNFLSNVSLLVFR